MSVGSWIAVETIRYLLTEVKMKRLIILILMILACASFISAAVNEAIINESIASYRDNGGPYNLTAEIVGDNNVLLNWCNPNFDNQPMGFKIYCNGCAVLTISGSNVTDCLINNVCGGCHQFYVTACFDTGCESPASNIAEIIVTSTSDNYANVNKLALVVYPNPARFNAFLTLSGMQKGNVATVSIYNLKGQLIRKMDLRGNDKGNWDLKDSSGKRVSDGVYYLKVATPQGCVAGKVILLK